MAGIWSQRVMDFSEKLTEHEVDGVMKSCIRLGSDEFTVPRHMMQGEKKAGLLYDHGEVSKWYWEGFCTFDGGRYIYFPTIALAPISIISTSQRSNALSILRTFAQLIAEGGKEVADLQVGIIPTWRFFIVDNDPEKLLLLPPDVSDLFSVYFEDDERYHYIGSWAKGGTEDGFSLIRQFGQLLYYALTGVQPYEDRKIRDYGYKELPLELYRPHLFSELDEKSEGFIDFTLHARSREQRDIMGNRSADRNLEWFLEQTEDLEWNVEDITGEELSKAEGLLDREGEVQDFWKKTEEGAKRHNFWRVKGTIIIASVIAAVLVIGFAASWIKSYLEPPLTKDLDQIGVIEAFYDAQSALDVTGLDTAVKGTSAPQETEVVNLYVTTQTRKAYESLRVITAEEWIADGRPAIDTRTLIYGVFDLELTETGENTYSADFSFYSPYSYDETEAPETTEIIDYLPLYEYREHQEFTLTWNDRGWWNITGITNPTVEFVQIVKVPFITEEQSQ